MIEALNKVGLLEKATVDDKMGGKEIALSNLNKKEIVTLVHCLGSDVSGDNKFKQVLKTAFQKRNHLTTVNDKWFVNLEEKNLAIVNKPKLFVRDAYKDIYDLVTAVPSRAILTGTSGVGKSCFLIYLLIRLLSEKEDEIIFFQDVDGDNASLYCLTSNFVRSIPSSDTATFLEQSNIWYLADGIMQPRTVSARSLLAISPANLGGKESNHIDTYKKEVVHNNIFYMPPWNLEELEICRAELFELVESEWLKTFFDKIGGVPRYTLEMPANAVSTYQAGQHNNNLDECTVATTSALNHLNQALENASHPVDIMISVYQNIGSLKHSNRLVHFIPDVNNYNDTSLKFASPYVEETIMDKIDNFDCMNQLVHDMMNSSSGTKRGISFEVVVGNILRKGDIEFTYRRLWDEGEDGNKEELLYNYKKPLAVKAIRTPEHIKEIKDGELAIPSKSNFPAIDFFVGPNSLFQVTVGTHHPIKQHLLVDLVRNTQGYSEENNKAPQIDLYFVVPDDIYSNFPHQNYYVDLQKKGNAKDTIKLAERQSAELTNVRQWALKIDYTKLVGTYAGKSSSIV